MQRSDNHGLPHSLARHPARLQPATAALVLFAKAPIPGRVKTRLCPPLTPDEAASLHGSLVLDAVERSRQAAKLARAKPGPGALDRFVACTPSSTHVFFKILAEREGLRLVEQIGENLGTRMDRCFRTLFDLGYQRVLLSGTDLPLLPASSYVQGLSLLADHDVVLGPSLDGGYYLVGLTRPAPELFADMPWSTDRVLALTLEKTRALGFTTALLSPCRDMDTADDLLAVIEESGLATRGSKGPPRAPSPELRASALSARTAGVLRVLASRLPLRPAAGPSRAADLRSG